MERTDQGAARRAWHGDQGAAIFRLAFRLSGNRQEAEDLVQETLRAYKQLQRFDGRATLATWLCRICVNCSLDLTRARKLRREQQALACGGDGAHHWLEQVAASAPSPERLSHSRQIASLLEPAMDGLSETERSAFVLRHYEGFAIGQIAEVRGVRCSRYGSSK